MKDRIGTEKVVHGRRWGEVHDGYFSDTGIAHPLVETAMGVLAESPADVVVDLGGGTGFLLSQLALRGVGAAATLVNVDCSEAQLAVAEEAGITRVFTPIEDFRRCDVMALTQRLFLIMRSVLHYAGQSGLPHLLRHLREQTKVGEFLVHQTAAFENDGDAACLNALYQHMQTDKWYPTVNVLESHLADSGWRVTDSIPAPALVLTSQDLGLRYALDSCELSRIRDVMAGEFGGMNKVFRLTPSGFRAELHYRIFTCVATP
ncbi:MAG: class I SAM-dependent methyltransferase [bacterium]